MQRSPEKICSSNAIKKILINSYVIFFSKIYLMFSSSNLPLSLLFFSMQLVLYAQKRSLRAFKKKENKSTIMDFRDLKCCKYNRFPCYLQTTKVDKNEFKSISSRLNKMHYNLFGIHYNGFCNIIKLDCFRFIFVSRVVQFFARISAFIK